MFPVPGQTCERSMHEKVTVTVLESSFEIDPPELSQTMQLESFGEELGEQTTPGPEHPQIVEWLIRGEEPSRQDTPAAELPRIVQSRISGDCPSLTMIPP